MNRNTLFSALVSKTLKSNRGINVDLDIPDLPDDVNYVKWQIPNNQDFEWINYKDMMESKPLKIKDFTSTSKKQVLTDDEGFDSVPSSPMQKQLLLDPKSSEMWENVLKCSISNYVDWDMRHE